jgi:hypothetical protein
MDMDKRDEVRKAVTQMNAEAVVALLQRQEETLRSYDQRIALMESRISVLEQAAQQQAADKYTLMAAAMGAGSTSG